MNAGLLGREDIAIGSERKRGRQNGTGREEPEEGKRSNENKENGKGELKSMGG